MRHYLIEEGFGCRHILIETAERDIPENYTNAADFVALPDGPALLAAWRAGDDSSVTEWERLVAVGHRSVGDGRDAWRVSIREQM